MRSIDRMFLGAAMASILAGTMARSARADQGSQATPQKMIVVPCYGLNACKGKGECGSKTDANGCGGAKGPQNQKWGSVSTKTRLAAWGPLGTDLKKTAYSES